MNMDTLQLSFINLPHQGVTNKAIKTLVVINVDQAFVNCHLTVILFLIHKTCYKHASLFHFSPARSTTSTSLPSRPTMLFSAKRIEDGEGEYETYSASSITKK